MQRYLDMGAALESQLKDLDGFISIERFQSVRDPDKLVALSFWRDEVLRDYRLRVAAVIRDYGKFSRAEAPADSRDQLGNGT